ncbi:ROK family protein, partial [Candidatus Woesearchaeota archaeon]|nr:ROK family protein [Candidatus Woesearchaeota archaeon]
MAVGLDIGASYIKGGIIKDGRVTNFIRLPTGKTKEQFLATLTRAINTLAKGESWVGLAVPGPADYARGIILDAPNLPVRNFNLQAHLKKELNIELTMANDAVCFTLAEALCGAGKGKSLVIGVTLGTGVGGGIVLNGKPLLGCGNAGHFSRMVLRNEPSKDHFFKYQTFEVLCSERGLLARAPGFNSGLEMANAARNGDKEALVAFREYGRDLGLGVGSLIAIFDPDIVVIGGGLSGNWDLFESEMRGAIAEVTSFKAEVVKHHLEQPGIVGASLL